MVNVVIILYIIYIYYYYIYILLYILLDILYIIYRMFLNFCPQMKIPLKKNNAFFVRRRKILGLRRSRRSGGAEGFQGVGNNVSNSH
jgi:hypothetical protein